MLAAYIVGIRKADQLFRHANGGLEKNRRDYLGRKGVFLADAVVKRHVVEQKDIHLRGLFFSWKTPS